jgi:hypothetical protein
VSLPAWAEAIVPVDMDGAAAVLGIARRTLVDVIRDHPHYERRGTRKVFYPEHIALLQLLVGGVRDTNKADALRRFVVTRIGPEKSAEAAEFLSRDRNGLVYLIRCAGRIKIGYATDLPQRLRVLLTACPYPASVIAAVAGDRELELFLHRCFAPLRRHGEWFEEAGDLRTLTAMLEAVGE